MVSHISKHFILSPCTIASWLDDPANTLCLCPEHVAKFLYGAREFTPDFRDQVKSYRGGPEHHLEVQLIGEQKRIRFTQRHIVDLKALMEVIENL